VTSQSDVTSKLRGMIEGLATSPMTLMEVCGTHTHAIFANGIRAWLPCLRDVPV
jgi:hydrogenase maturation factor